MAKIQLPNDLIIFIDKLEQDIGSSVCSTEQTRNPLAAIITPEWYYSNSIRIKEGINSKWESLEKTSVIKKSERITELYLI